jgi:N-formylmaleamate deformylase
VKGPFFETMSAGIARYVKDKKLTKPVLVGHSIGAALALKAAADHPDVFGGVVMVDGFPSVFALIDPAATPTAMRQAGDAERAKLEKATREEYTAAMRQMFGQWLTGEKLDTAMKWLAAADQPTIARAKGELFTLDLRPAVEKVTIPVLVLGAFDKGYEQLGVTREVFETRIKSQVANAKSATVAIRDNCKHFIMYDAPDWMWAEMAKVLK